MWGLHPGRTLPLGHKAHSINSFPCRSWGHWSALVKAPSNRIHHIPAPQTTLGSGCPSPHPYHPLRLTEPQKPWFLHRHELGGVEGAVLREHTQCGALWVRHQPPQSHGHPVPEALPATRWVRLLEHRIALNLDSSVPRRFSPAAYRSCTEGARGCAKQLAPSRSTCAGPAGPRGGRKNTLGCSPALEHEAAERLLGWRLDSE